MTAIVHIVLLGLVAGSGYIVYGVSRRDWAAESYLRSKNVFPFSMMIAIMSLKAYTWMYRVLTVYVLAFFLWLYVWFLFHPDLFGI